MDVISSEDGAGWLAFFRSLMARGLVRGPVGDLRRPRRAYGGDRRDLAGCLMAEVPNPL
jgi:putative transposase